MSTQTPTRRGAPEWLKAIAKSRELSIVIVLVVILAFTTSAHPTFLFSPDGWREFLRTPSVLILIAVGEGIVIITRNIDLSVGSTLGLTAYFAGYLLSTYPAIPIIIVVLLTVFLGAIMGMINGLLVAFFKVPSLIITLGTLYAYRGIDVLWVGSNNIVPSQLPQSFENFGVDQLGSIPYVMIVAVVVVLITAWFMRNRRTGREFYAVGSDPDAAILYGLPTRKLVLTTFVISGTLTGLAGVIYLAAYASVDSQVGSGYELQAVAAAVVGGVAILGGSGTIWGVALGALLLQTISSALNAVGIPSLWQQAVTGVFIVGAIALDRALFLNSLRKSRSRSVGSSK
ncbi:MAG TPA: ABC transporter permease [Galbitalea sp.]|nr:ABC transporter permease [Galbitalea sp.]